MPANDGVADGEGGLRLIAPAKINLTLEVLRKRDDGFHDLDTVITTISLADEIRLRPAEALSVQFSGRRAREIDEDGELCAAAVQARAEASGRAPNVAIEVAKRIPVAAGLAGGSSDAAAVLRGLNQLCDLDWSIEELTDRTARLGAHVPVVLPGRAAPAANPPRPSPAPTGRRKTRKPSPSEPAAAAANRPRKNPPWPPNRRPRMTATVHPPPSSRWKSSFR